MPRRPPRIHRFDDGSLVVAGTGDLAEARRLLGDEGSTCRCDPVVLEVHDCTPPALRTAWFRMVPGPQVWQGTPDQDIILRPARPRARGAFEAVVF